MFTAHPGAHIKKLHFYNKNHVGLCYLPAKDFKKNYSYCFICNHKLYTLLSLSCRDKSFLGQILIIPLELYKEPL